MIDLNDVNYANQANDGSDLIQTVCQK